MLLGKRKRRMTSEEQDAILERAKDEAPLELEKGDKLAMFFAALIVFVPFLLAMSGVLFLVWLFIVFVWGG